MSATMADAFVDELRDDPTLRETAESEGIAQAAAAAGFDVEPSELEAALESDSREELPDHKAPDSANQACCGTTVATCAITGGKPPTGCRY